MAAFLLPTLLLLNHTFNYEHGDNSVQLLSMPEAPINTSSLALLSGSPLTPQQTRFIANKMKEMTTATRLVPGLLKVILTACIDQGMKHLKITRNQMKLNMTRWAIFLLLHN